MHPTNELTCFKVHGRSAFTCQKIYNTYFESLSMYEFNMLRN